jgi:tetratricopeptide (TPR) repeat protein
MCAGDVNPQTRSCGYCGSTLIPITGDKAIWLNNFDINKRLSELRDNIKKDPSDAFAHYAIGVAYLNKGINESAIDAFRKSILLEPEHAIVHYDMALAIFNDGNIRINSEQYQECMRRIDDAVTNSPEFNEARAFKHFFTARKLDEIDRQEAAKEYYEAISICHDIPTFYNNYGLCLYYLNRYEDAISTLNTAIDLCPTFYLAHSNLCLTYYKLNKFTLGVEAGKKAVDNLKSTSINAAFAYNNYSLCLWKTGNLQLAQEMIKKAIANEPNNTLFRNNLKAYTNNSGCLLLLLLLTSTICLLACSIN